MAVIAQVNYALGKYFILQTRHGNEEMVGKVVGINRGAGHDGDFKRLAMVCLDTIKP